MDLVPINPIEAFSVNWSGWSFIERVLQLAGADTSEMAWVNDGYPVRAETAKAWAKAIEELLAKRGELRLKLAKVPHEGYAGGHVFVPVVEYAKARPEEKVYLKLKLGSVPSIVDQIRSYLRIDIALLGFKPCIKKISIVELDDRKKLVESFVRFCKKSGGFKQF